MEQEQNPVDVAQAPPGEVGGEAVDVVRLALVTAATASASAINGTDRTNAARACSALRASSAAAFANQYASFGACTSVWVQKAHADARGFKLKSDFAKLKVPNYPL